MVPVNSLSWHTAITGLEDRTDLFSDCHSDGFHQVWGMELDNYMMTELVHKQPYIAQYELTNLSGSWLCFQGRSLVPMFSSLFSGFLHRWLTFPLFETTFVTSLTQLCRSGF